MKDLLESWVWKNWVSIFNHGRPMVNGVISHKIEYTEEELLNATAIFKSRPEFEQLDPEDKKFLLQTYAALIHRCKLQYEDLESFRPNAKKGQIIAALADSASGEPLITVRRGTPKKYPPKVKETANPNVTEAAKIYAKAVNRYYEKKKGIPFFVHKLIDEIDFWLTRLMPKIKTDAIIAQTLTSIGAAGFDNINYINTRKKRGRKIRNKP